jgi:cytochrome c-type biogenesis protein CcmH/NrfG
VEPHLLLGRHLVFSSDAKGGTAELLKTLELAQGPQREEVYWYLAFGYYLQEKWKEALYWAELYLDAHPKDQAMLLIKSQADTAAGGGEKPKRIEIRQ